MGIATRLTELIRFVEFVPYRLPRIWEMVTNSGVVHSASSSTDLFDLLGSTEGVVINGTTWSPGFKGKLFADSTH